MTDAARSVDVALIAGYGESVVLFRGPLLQELRARGLSVLVIAPGIGEGTRGWLQRHGITFAELSLARTGVNPLQDLQYCWQLRRTLLAHKPRVVLAYTVKPVVYGLPLARVSGVERRYALITGLGFAFTEGEQSWVGRLARALYRAALRVADGVFFQNPDDHALFKARGLLARRTPSHVVNGSGIDLKAYEFVDAPQGPAHFLMIARLLGDKGVREYVAAASRLKARHPLAVWSLVGFLDENPSAVTQQELDDWVASGVVRFLGRLDDVRPALRDCSVYVLPSYREGTPRTVLEAMAVGRAVVTTDAPGCRETVVDGENGYLVPVRSVDELADAMERFIEQPDLAARMGAASRRIAEHKYDVRMVNREMLGRMAL